LRGFSFSAKDRVSFPHGKLVVQAWAKAQVVKWGDGNRPAQNRGEWLVAKRREVRKVPDEELERRARRGNFRPRFSQRAAKKNADRFSQKVTGEILFKQVEKVGPSLCIRAIFGERLGSGLYRLLFVIDWGRGRAALARPAVDAPGVQFGLTASLRGRTSKAPVCSRGGGRSSSGVVSTVNEKMGDEKLTRRGGALSCCLGARKEMGIASFKRHRRGKNVCEAELRDGFGR